MTASRFLRGTMAMFTGLAFAASLTGGVAAEELRIASGTVSKNALNGGMYRFAELIEDKTGGAYTGKVFAGTLLTFAEMLNGVRDGIVDVGFVIPAYARAEFPNTNLMIDMSTAGTDPVIMVGAINDYMYSCPDCLAEFKKQNHIFLGLSTAGPYYMMSKDKISSLGDFAGQTIRGFGPFGRWIEAMGGQSVLVTSSDVYESLSQGQLDGNTQGLDTLKSMSLGEIVDYVLNEPIGLYLGSAMYDVNRDRWAGMSDEHKRAFLLAAGEGHAFTTIGYFNENNAFLEDPASGDVEIIEPDAELAAASAAFKAQDLDTVARLAKERYGIENAQESVEKMRGLVEKWTALFDGVDTNDVDAVGEILNREIFSKIDLDSL